MLPETRFFRKTGFLSPRSQMLTAKRAVVSYDLPPLFWLDPVVAGLELSGRAAGLVPATGVCAGAGSSFSNSSVSLTVSASFLRHCATYAAALASGQHRA